MQESRKAALSVRRPTRRWLPRYLGLNSCKVKAINASNLVSLYKASIKLSYFETTLELHLHLIAISPSVFLHIWYQYIVLSVSDDYHHQRMDEKPLRL